MEFQRKIHKRYWHGAILPIVVFICFLLFLYFGISNVSTANEKQNLKIFQNALYRSVVQCYAIEGMYPPDVQYLEDHYDLVYNHDQFIVHYEVFASNILPDIVIIDKSVQ